MDMQIDPPAPVPALNQQVQDEPQMQEYNEIEEANLGFQAQQAGQQPFENLIAGERNLEQEGMIQNEEQAQQQSIPSEH
jgi:hypothetical protein